jgi:pilus assembly protein TadC
MAPMTAAAVFLAAALLANAGPSAARTRAGLPVRKSRLRRRPDLGQDPLALASSLDVLAVCLTSGMPVAAAAAATAVSAPPNLADILCRAADLLTLGADPAVAWSTPPQASSAIGQTEALLRLARRSASSGAALADGVAELAAQSRHDAEQAAEATAERAAVLIAGPLGLCFLPAFVCLGVAPVIAGLAGKVLQSGLL